MFRLRAFDGLHELVLLLLELRLRVECACEGRLR